MAVTPARLEFTAEALMPLGSAATSPQFSVVTQTTVISSVWLFDTSTQEYLFGRFTVPADITTGTVTFTVKGYSATAAASKNVAFDFDHAAVANDEDVDSATYTTEASGDKATINNQNDLELHSWTETVTNTGWVAGDLVYFRISRKAASANNLATDWGMWSFMIDIPVTGTV